MGPILRRAWWVRGQPCMGWLQAGARRGRAYYSEWPPTAVDTLASGVFPAQMDPGQAAAWCCPARHCTAPRAMVEPGWVRFLPSTLTALILEFLRLSLLPMQGLMLAAGSSWPARDF